MGIITKLGITAISAGIGFGAGYLLYEHEHIDIPVATIDCRAEYQQGLTSLEESAKKFTSLESLATPRDFKIEYVVAADQQFNGLVFTDLVTNHQGIITKHPVLGKSMYTFMYADLGSMLAQAPVYQIQPELRTSLPSFPEATSASQESLLDLIEKKIRRKLSD